MEWLDICGVGRLATALPQSCTGFFPLTGKKLPFLAAWLATFFVRAPGRGFPSAALLHSAFVKIKALFGFAPLLPQTSSSASTFSIFICT
jgi:hypothetical protein